MGNAKRVLVTGGCGYIGSHVTRQLSESGYEVIVFDNLSTGFVEALIHGESLKVGDLSSVSALDALMSTYRFDAVFHFAASIVVPESVANPLGYYQNNTVNSINLFQACIKHGVSKLVFSSTAAVYGENELDLVCEDTPTEPANPYAQSKLMDETILSDVAKAHPEFNYVVLRYFNVAGADPETRMGQRFPNATHLIKVACEAALGKRESITLFGEDYPTRDGTCIRDYIHIEDLADAHLRALAYLEEGGDNVTLNCGYGRGFTVREVLDAVEKVSGKPLPLQIGERRPGDISRIVADSTKIKELFGWKPRFDDLDAIVRDAYKWESRL